MYRKKITALLVSIALCVQPVCPVMAAEDTGTVEMTTEENSTAVKEEEKQGAEEEVYEDDIYKASEDGAEASETPAESKEEYAEDKQEDYEITKEAVPEDTDAVEKVPAEETEEEPKTTETEGSEAGRDAYNAQSYAESDVTVEVYKTELDHNGKEREITYSGGKKEPYVSVRIGGKYLTKDKDFTVSYENNVNAGTATAHVTGMGDYEFTKDAQFTIRKYTLVQDDVTLMLNAYENRYNRHSYANNDYYVSAGSKMFKEGTDYTVSGDTDLNKSGAKVTITGKGNCQGTVTAQFPSYEEMTVDIGGEYVYMCAPKPAVTVKIGNKTLTQGTSEGNGDYYVKTTATGGSMLQVEVIGSYDGADIYEYTNIRMDKYQLTKANTSIEKTSYVYTGDYIKPAVTVKVNDTVLKENEDYTLEYKNNLKVGNASVIVHGGGYFTGDVELAFTISKESTEPEVKPVTVSVKGQSSFTYDGSAKKAEIEVKYGDTVVPAKYYTVTYSGNVNAGTAKASVSGSYDGQDLKGEVSYKILQKELTSTNVSAEFAETAEDTVVFCDGKQLKQGSECSVNITKPADPSTGTWTAAISGKGNYNGTVKLSYKQSDIKGAGQKEITPAIIISGTSFVYNGKVQKPSVTVMDGSSTLTEGRDYTVAVPDSVNTGSYKVAVTLKGGYTGQGTAEYKITAKKITPDIKLSASSFVYNGKAQKPSVTVMDGSTVLAEGKDYTVSVPESVNTGSYTVSVTLKGNYAGTGSKSYSIAERTEPIVPPVIAFSDSVFTYNGKVQKPVITVTREDSVLREGTDYTVSAPNSVNVGDYKATITMKDGSLGPVTIAYKIIAKKLTPKVKLSKTSFIYNGKVQRPSVTVMDGSESLTKGRDYTMTTQNSVNAGTYKITINLTGNYTGSASAVYKITAKKVTPVVTLSHKTLVYNGKVRKPSVTVKADGKKLPASGYTVTYAKGRKQVGTYNVAVKLKGNYTGMKMSSFKIIPKGTSITKLSPVKNKLAITVRWKKQAVQTTGYQIQYSPDRNFKKKAKILTVKGASKTAATVRGLKNRVPYYFRIRTFKRIGKGVYYSSWEY